MESYSKETTATILITTFLTLPNPKQLYLQCKSYLQKKRCVMGKLFSPAYVSIALDELERKFIYPFAKTIGHIQKQSCILAKNVTFVLSLVFRFVKGEPGKLSGTLHADGYVGRSHILISFRNSKVFERYSHLFQRRFYDTSRT